MDDVGGEQEYNASIVEYKNTGKNFSQKDILLYISKFPAIPSNPKRNGIEKLITEEEV